MSAGLADLRVLAVEQYGAGPFASLHLAELGAEVIKVEAPGEGGDIGRYVPPYQEEDDSLFFQAFNRGKRSVALDLRSPAGQSVFRRLVARSDAVLCNLRGDVPAKLGLRYADLQSVNPRIVCCLLSGYGGDGPRAAEPAYDYVLQATAGWMSLTGEPDGPPTKSGLSLVDYCGGLVAALSLLAGVHVARREGHGGDCDVSLFDTAVSMLTYPAAWWLNEQHRPSRIAQSGHPSLVPFGAFPTADGWLVLACVKERFWRAAAEVMGRPDLPADPRFATMQARFDHREELVAILNEVLRERTTDAWVRELAAVGVPCGPVHDLPGALADPQTIARGLVVEVPHRRRGRVRVARTASRGWWPAGARSPAPGFDADRHHLQRELLELGDEEIAGLERVGAFGSRGRSA